MKTLKQFFHANFRIIPLVILLGLAYSCATIVAPSGGEKDITPPVLLRSEPRNQSTHFSGNKIILSFNEYIQLKEMDKNLLISPPLNKDPDFKIKGRSLIVKLKDTLRNNTTYSFYFGNGIVDLTEMNPLNNFSLAFSTGDIIDSLSLMGKVSDAFNRVPVKDALVMLYTDLADSAPMLQRPVYVSRTQDGGIFKLSSLAAGKYRLVALIDGDNSYTYNQPSEQIAFSDSLLEPYYIPPARIDTSVAVNTSYADKIGLSMFTEPDSIQRISKAAMVAPHQMLIAFRYPAADPVIQPMNIDSSLAWSVSEQSAHHDSITFWLKGTLPDTLRLKVSDKGMVTDTLEIATLFKLKTSGRKSQVADTTLKFQSVSSKSGYLDWNTDYFLTFSNPLRSFDAGMARLLVGETPDTLIPVIEFADPLQRKVKVKYAWKTMVEYALLLPKGMFSDIYGAENDSVKFAFKLRSKDEYGNFKVQIKLVNVDHPVIIQLLSEKGDIVQQRNITGSQKIDFGYLTPAKYGLRAIYDRNGNGKWDTGVFLKKQQPERVAIHPKTFEVRGNWELEEEWEL